MATCCRGKQNVRDMTKLFGLAVAANCVTSMTCCLSWQHQAVKRNHSEEGNSDFRNVSNLLNKGFNLNDLDSLLAK